MLFKAFFKKKRLTLKEGKFIIHTLKMYFANPDSHALNSIYFN